MLCCFRSVSATYQWGGVARLDLVSAPHSTALVFYGPPALHVHAMPLLSQLDLVQSAAAQARTSQHDSSQHDSAQRDSAQRDSAQGDSAQLATAQHDSAQANLTRHNLSSSQQNGSVTLHNTEHHAADAQPGVFSNDQDLSQTPQAVDSEADEGVSPTEHSSDRQLQPQAHQLSQAEPHATVGYQEAAADEEDGGDDEGLFAEASVLARGGLKVTEKVSQTWFGVSKFRSSKSLHAASTRCEVCVHLCGGDSGFV